MEGEKTSASQLDVVTVNFSWFRLLRRCHIPPVWLIFCMPAAVFNLCSEESYQVSLSRRVTRPALEAVENRSMVVRTLFLTVLSR